MLLQVVALLLAVFARASPFGFILEGNDESAVLQHLNNFIASGRQFTQADGASAIDFAMSRGWFNVSKRILDASVEVGIDLATTVHQTATRIKTQLQQLQDALQSKKATGASAGIAPAFEWAQSPDSVFLNVKFSHKLDTPATLGCLSESIVFLSRSVTYRATCKDKKKVFHLSLDLLRDIIPDNSTVTMASVGRAMLTLRKADNSTGVWPRLTVQTKKLPNSHVWWAMAEKHAGENDAFERERRKQREAAEDAAAAKEAETAAGDTTTGAALSGGDEDDAAPAVTVGSDGEVAAAEPATDNNASPAAEAAAGGSDAADVPGKADGQGSGSGGVGSILSAAAEAVNNLFTLPGAAAAPVPGRRGSQSGHEEDAEDVDVFDESDEGAVVLPRARKTNTNEQVSSASVGADGGVTLETGVSPSKPPASATATAAPAAAAGSAPSVQPSKARPKPATSTAAKGDKTGSKAQTKAKDAKKEQKGKKKARKTDDDDDNEADRIDSDLNGKEPPMRISSEMMFQQLAGTIEARRQQELAQIPRAAKEARAEVHAKYEKEFDDLRKKLGMRD